MFLVPTFPICYDLLRLTAVLEKRSRRKEVFMPYQRNPGSPSSTPVVVVRRRSPRVTEKTPHTTLPVKKNNLIPSPGSSQLDSIVAAPSGKAATPPVPKEEALKLLVILRERWPQTFPLQSTEVRPLALNIDQEIATQLEGWSAKQARRAIAFWKRPRTVAYLRVLAAGGPRYDLNGTPQGVITPEEQQHAARQLSARSARRQAQKPLE